VAESHWYLKNTLEGLPLLDVKVCEVNFDLAGGITVKDWQNTFVWNICRELEQIWIELFLLAMKGPS
jgi:hypothetical protein